MQDFDFEVMEYFNGDNDNMDPARKFWFTFSEDFSELAITTTIYGEENPHCSCGRKKPLLKHTMLYKLTDELYDGQTKIKEFFNPIENF